MADSTRATEARAIRDVQLAALAVWLNAAKAVATDEGFPVLVQVNRAYWRAVSGVMREYRGALR